VEVLQARELPAVLALPYTSVPNFMATFNGADQPLSGGNFLGALDGATQLTASYCVRIDQTISPPETFNSATVNNSGIVYGTTINQANAISWLVTNLGPIATTPEQQDALQAAIWKTEYGNAFQMDGVDNTKFNDPTIMQAYQADRKALGSHTAGVGSVDWISPGQNPDGSFAQGLVASFINPAPIPDLTATAGTEWSGTVATFKDNNPGDDASSLSATITWGNGETTDGMVSGAGNSFSVSGNMTYNQEGRYPLGVLVSDGAGTVVFAGAGNVHVARLGPPPVALNPVANALTHSAEYYSDIVTAVYQNYLGRSPQASEVAAWVGLMQQGLSDERLEAGFIGSPEYIANHGGPGAGWVKGMYQNLLGRTPLQSEVNAWVRALEAGASPTQIAYDFAASAEREGQRITADYQKYLGRAPSPTEVRSWVSAFESGYSNENVIAGFVGSPEYFQTHYDNSGDWLYSAYEQILNRAPDAGGIQAWLGMLEAS
jgi:hypothetical protein